MHRHLILAAVCLVFTAAVAQESRGPSTPDERTRVLRIARELQADPISPKVADDRDWAMEWLIAVPDVTVTLCDGVFGDFDKEKGYRYSGDILAVHALGSAAFIIEHPNQKEDEVAIQRAGVLAALKAYEIIRKQDARRGPSAALDALLRQRDSGELDSLLVGAVSVCTSGPRRQT